MAITGGWSGQRRSYAEEAGLKGPSKNGRNFVTEGNSEYCRWEGRHRDM